MRCLSPLLSLIAVLLAQLVGVSNALLSPLQVRSLLLPTARDSRSSVIIRAPRRAMYGRGAEIWPPSNGEAIRLSDSFPNQQLPPIVESRFGYPDNGGFPPPSTLTDPELAFNIDDPQATMRPPSLVSKILRRSVQNSAYPKAVSSRKMSRFPIVAACLSMPFLKPVDTVLAIALPLYIHTLIRISRKPRSPTNATPILPAIPPQQHVPRLIQQPLGFSIQYSVRYDLWLKCGYLLGVVLPMASLIWQLYQPAPASSTRALRFFQGSKLRADLVWAATCRMIARPLFFLCTQAMMEERLSRTASMMASMAANRRNPATPLPIRILTTVLYQMVRLPYVWQWCVSPTGSFNNNSFYSDDGGDFLQVLAVLNMIYWTINLFGFVIPVGVMR